MSSVESMLATSKEAGEGGSEAVINWIANLEAAIAALRGLKRPEGLPAPSRLVLAAQLDDDARADLAEALISLAEVPPADQAGWRRLAAAAYELFGALVDVYESCLAISEGELAEESLPPDEGSVRLLRAGADLVMWEQFACRAGRPRLWSLMGSVFASAVERGEALDSSSRISSEYLRAVALYSAALDQLPADLGIAVGHLVQWQLGKLEFQAGVVPTALCFVDPAAGRPPQRLVRPAAHQNGVWFFSPLAAAAALHALAREARNGSIRLSPFLTALGTDRALAAVAHLQRQWSSTPPARRYRRHVLEGRLSAIRGFRELHSALSGETAGRPASWSLRDISRGGVGAIAPATSLEPFVIGELIGLRADGGGGWHLGIVRRIRPVDGGEALVGIETLSQHPVMMRVDDGRTPTEVVVCDPILRGEAVRIAAPLYTLREGVPLFVTANGTVQKLKSLDAAYSGNGFELRVYQVL